MQCPKCKHQITRVVDSREGADGRSVRRRRECESCGFRFTTFERLEENLPLVVKKGGQREAFDRGKILAGLKKACEERPVTVEQMEDVVRAIESSVIEGGLKEISSERIGELLIGQLQQLDQVSYVRFASVYREFSDVNEFMETLRTLVAKSEIKSAQALTIKDRVSSEKSGERATPAQGVSVKVHQRPLSFGEQDDR